MLPTTLEQWLAWAGLVVPLATLAFAAVRHVNSEAKRRQSEKDARLQQLANIIYNKGGEFGLGAQILAVGELERFKKESWALNRYVESIGTHFKAVNASPDLISALEELKRRLKK